MNGLRVALLAVLLLATGSGAVVAARQVLTARDGVESVRLAAQSENVAAIDPAMSRLLAVAAWRAAPTPEARRGLLATLTRPLTAVLRGHRNSVYAVAYNREGTLLATGGADGTLRIWDARSYQPTGEPLRGHRGAITQVTFAGNGRVITASRDRTIRIWNGEKQAGRPIAGTIVAPDPGGRVLAVGDQNGVPRLINMTTRRQLGRAFPRHPSGLRDLTFDGRTMTTYDNAGVLRIWNARTHRLIGRVAGGPGPITIDQNNMAFTLQGTLRRLDLGTRRQTGRPIRGDFVALAYGSKGNLLATAQRSGAVHVLEAGVLLAEPFRAGSVRDLAFSPDGHWLATASDDEVVRIWDISLTRKLSGEPITTAPGTSAPTASTAPGTLTPGIPTPGRSSASTSTPSPDGTTIAVGDTAGRTQLFDMKTGKPAGAPMACRPGVVNAVAFSPDGQGLATATANSVCLWDARTQRQLHKRLTGHTGQVNTLTYSPDGRNLVSGGDDHTIRWWDVATGTPGDLTLAQASGISALAFDPRDPTHLATGTQNGTVRLWDITEKLPIGPPFLGHTAPVTSIAFSGDTLATAAGNIRLWDLATHKQLGAPLGRTLRTVTFSPDGRELIGGGPAGARRLWNAALTPDPAAEVCALARRFPPPLDLRSYLPDQNYPEICP
jgi:WD40 repeat protein